MAPLTGAAKTAVEDFVMEALVMDPQQRLLLEMGYASLHGGSERLSSLRATGVGVFVGIMNTDYASIQKDGGVYAATGATISIAAGRLSFALGDDAPQSRH